MIRTKKNAKEDAASHRWLVLEFDTINSSKKGDIITAIYDRSASWNGVLSFPSLSGKN